MSEHPAGFFEGTEMPTEGWWEPLWPNPEAVLAAAGLRAGMDAVDLCCGDGWFTLPMAKISDHVFAIDIDRNFLQLARDRLDAAGIRNCDFIEGDAYEIDELVQRSVDFVFMANTFHGVPDPLRLARSVRATLKPSGRFTIINWHQRPREETTVMGKPRGPKTELRKSPEQTIKSVETKDLVFVQAIELPPYHYGIAFERSGP
jgi:ubiquinone/menaquinone biosynthesis C-methylase UbiE